MPVVRTGGVFVDIACSHRHGGSSSRPFISMIAYLFPPMTPLPAMKPMQQATINRLNMYKAKGIRDKKGKLVGGAYMMKNRSGDQAITAETGGVPCVLPRAPFTPKSRLRVQILRRVFVRGKKCSPRMGLLV